MTQWNWRPQRGEGSSAELLIRDDSRQVGILIKIASRRVYESESVVQQ